MLCSMQPALKYDKSSVRNGIWARFSLHRRVDWPMWKNYSFCDGAHRQQLLLIQQILWSVNLFHPLCSERSDMVWNTSVKVSVSSTEWCVYSIRNEPLLTLAFPAIGCGGFKMNENLIATTMINSAREELNTNSAVSMKVTFVIPQSHVYNAFCAQLQSRPTPNLSRSSSSAQSNDDHSKW